MTPPRIAGKAIVLMAGLVVAACGDRESSDLDLGTITVRGDTVIRHVGAPIYPEGGSLLPEVTIGLLDGPEEYLFGLIGDVAMGPDGSVYILDAQAANVRQYDSEGRFVRSVGREGDGPGEFRLPSLLATHPDGRVMVAEGRRGIVHVYSASGDFLTTWSVGHVIDRPISVDTAGIVYVRLQGTLPAKAHVPLVPGRVGDGLRYFYVVRSMPGERFVGGTPVLQTGILSSDPGMVRLSPDGTVLDSIPAPVLPDLTNYAVSAEDPAEVRAYFGLPYVPFSWWARSPRGHLISGVATEYAINLHLSSAGQASDSIVSIRRETPPVPVVSHEREVVQARFDQHIGDLEALRWHGSRDAPERKPPYYDVIPASDGRLWVALHTPSVQDPSGEWHEPETLFDVYEPDGSYLGQVRGSEGIRPAAIDGDILWGQTKDSLGVDRVTRFRVAWD